MTLEEAQQQVATKWGYEHFNDLIGSVVQKGLTKDVIRHLNEGSELFAHAKCTEQKNICWGKIMHNISFGYVGVQDIKDGTLNSPNACDL